MKVCKHCKISYLDQYSICPRCGNSLQYYPDNVPGSIPMVQAKQKTFFFAEFIKEYFKSPVAARNILNTHKDFGSCLLMNGITLVVIFIYFICLQLGLTIQYDTGFSAVITIVCPILFYALSLGFQYLDIFIYSIYIKGVKHKKMINPAITAYTRCCSSCVFSVMILLLASLFAIISPVLGALLLPSVIGIGICTSAEGKIECGDRPTTLLDHFMFVLTGVVAFGFVSFIVFLFIYICVRSNLSSVLFDYFL